MNQPPALSRDWAAGHTDSAQTTSTHESFKGVFADSRHDLVVHLGGAMDPSKGRSGMRQTMSHSSLDTVNHQGSNYYDSDAQSISNQHQHQSQQILGIAQMTSARSSYNDLLSASPGPSRASASGLARPFSVSDDSFGRGSSGANLRRPSQADEEILSVLAGLDNGGSISGAGLALGLGQDDGMGGEGGGRAALNADHQAATAGGYPDLQTEPSRTLFMRNIPLDIPDEELYKLMQAFGDIRNLYTSCKPRGFILVTYYDLRSAVAAQATLNGHLLVGLPLEVRFHTPQSHSSGINQGVVVMFNLDPDTTNEQIVWMFSKFGDVKGIHEAPNRRSQKMITFYDVRHALVATRAMNKAEHLGKLPVAQQSTEAQQQQQTQHQQHLQQQQQAMQQQQRSLSQSQLQATHTQMPQQSLQHSQSHQHLQQSHSQGQLSLSQSQLQLQQDIAAAGGSSMGGVDLPASAVGGSTDATLLQLAAQLQNDPQSLQAFAASSGWDASAVANLMQLVQVQAQHAQALQAVQAQQAVQAAAVQHAHAQAAQQAAAVQQLAKSLSHGSLQTHPALSMPGAYLQPAEQQQQQANLLNSRHGSSNNMHLSDSASSMASSNSTAQQQAHLAQQLQQQQQQHHFYQTVGGGSNSFSLAPARSGSGSSGNLNLLGPSASGGSGSSRHLPPLHNGGGSGGLSAHHPGTHHSHHHHGHHGHHGNHPHSRLLPLAEGMAGPADGSFYPNHGMTTSASAHQLMSHSSLAGHSTLEHSASDAALAANMLMELQLSAAAAGLNLGGSGAQSHHGSQQQLWGNQSGGQHRGNMMGRGASTLSLASSASGHPSRSNSEVSLTAVAAAAAAAAAAAVSAGGGGAGGMWPHNGGAGPMYNSSNGLMALADLQNLTQQQQQQLALAGLQAQNDLGADASLNANLNAAAVQLLQAAGFGHASLGGGVCANAGSAAGAAAAANFYQQAAAAQQQQQQHALTQAAAAQLLQQAAMAGLPAAMAAANYNAGVGGGGNLGNRYSGGGSNRGGGSHMGSSNDLAGRSNSGSGGGGGGPGSIQHAGAGGGGRLSRRTTDPSAEAERKQQQEKLYALDLAKIARGEDRRTTLMIKNIPNKYTQKMLLATVDELFRGSYDFFYLPIDFKNKCNVGYAFINMVSPSAIPPLVERFNHRKWERFNSEKVCHISYARIQGRAALVAHFQNSSLMHEDKRCRPILFTADGNEAGEPEPFPSPATMTGSGSGSLAGSGGLGRAGSSAAALAGIGGSSGALHVPPPPGPSSAGDGFASTSAVATGSSTAVAGEAQTATAPSRGGTGVTNDGGQTEQEDAVPSGDSVGERAV